MTKISNQYSLTNVLFADTTNGRVGIGTTSPSYQISSSAASTNYISIDNTSNNYRLLIGAESAATALYSRNLSTNAAIDMRFVVGTSEAIRITSAGNVGIGTTSPNAIGANIGLSINHATDAVIELNRAGARAGFLYVDSGKFLIQDYRNLPLIFGTSDTERMRITGAGLAGIGTTSPDYALTISGSTDATSGIRIKNTNGTTSAPRIIIEQNNAQKMNMYSYGDSFAFNYTLTGGVSFYDGVNNLTRLYINGSGNVGIGTSSPNYVTTIADSTWSNGSTISYLFNIRKAYGSGVVFGCYVGEYSQDSVGFTINQKVYNQAASTTQTFTINNSGNYSFWGSNVSDRRLKRNISYIEDSQLDNIMLLKPATFNKIVDNEVNTNVHTGFIAQDILESNIPNLIMGSEETSYGLDYDGILALAVKAIQELSADLTSAKQEIELLKAK